MESMLIGSMNSSRALKVIITDSENLFKEAPTLHTVRALNSYRAVKPGELDISENMTLHVFKKEDREWFAESGGRFGTFPQHFIDPNQQQTNIIIKRFPSNSSMPLSASDMESDLSSSSSSSSSSSMTFPGKKKKSSSPRIKFHKRKDSLTRRGSDPPLAPHDDGSPPSPSSSSEDGSGSSSGFSKRRRSQSHSPRDPSDSMKPLKSSPRSKRVPHPILLASSSSTSSSSLLATEPTVVSFAPRVYASPAGGTGTGPIMFKRSDSISPLPIDSLNGLLSPSPSSPPSSSSVSSSVSSSSSSHTTSCSSPTSPSRDSSSDGPKSPKRPKGGSMSRQKSKTIPGRFAGEIDRIKVCFLPFFLILVVSEWPFQWSNWPTD